jgi:fluoroquinolone transport system permease protein
MSATAELRLLVSLELRLLWRHGVVAAIALVAAVWAGLLRVLPTEVAADVLPAALYVDAAIVGVLFVAAAVLIERRQGTLEALAVSPLRVSSYVAAKVVTLTGLALRATLGIALVVSPGPRVLPLVAGVLSLSPPVLLVALVVVARSDTITGYLLRVQGPLTPAMLPLLALAGWVPWWVAWLGPTTGPFRLLEAGTGGSALAGWEWGLALAASVAATAVLWRLAVQRVRVDLLRAGRFA